LFLIVLLSFYAGELVWRERQVKLDQVLDAAPVQSWSVLAGKFAAMITLMLVGHNPGMQELAFGLADPAASDREALRRLSRKYPTAGIAILEQDGGWKDVAPGSMRLSTFITPRALGGIDED
jgi:phosphohistidine phosphatase